MFGFSKTAEYLNQENQFGSVSINFSLWNLVVFRETNVLHNPKDKHFQIKADTLKTMQDFSSSVWQNTYIPQILNILRTKERAVKLTG